MHPASPRQHPMDMGCRLYSQFMNSLNLLREHEVGRRASSSSRSQNLLRTNFARDVEQNLAPSDFEGG